LYELCSILKAILQVDELSSHYTTSAYCQLWKFLFWLSICWWSGNKESEMIKRLEEKHSQELSHPEVTIILLGLLLPARLYWRSTDRLPVDWFLCWFTMWLRCSMWQCSRILQMCVSKWYSRRPISWRMPCSSWVQAWWRLSSSCRVHTIKWSTKVQR
jgi:hypothetical protein